MYRGYVAGQRELLPSQVPVGSGAVLLEPTLNSTNPVVNYPALCETLDANPRSHHRRPPGLGPQRRGPADRRAREPSNPPAIRPRAVAAHRLRGIGAAGRRRSFLERRPHSARGHRPAARNRLRADPAGPGHPAVGRRADRRHAASERDPCVRAGNPRPLEANDRGQTPRDWQSQADASA